MIHLAQEIWDGVVRDLPSFSARTAAQVFGFKLVKFKCGITLNISDIRYDCDFHGPERFVVSPMRLLSYRSQGFRSSYLLWKDNTDGLRQIDSHHGQNIITDERGYPATELSDVRRICTIELCDHNNNTWQVELVDPEEHKKEVADFQAHRRNPNLDLRKPEMSAKDPPTRLNRAVSFPNRVIKDFKKSKTPEARLVSHLMHHNYFRIERNQPSNITAGSEYETDTDEIY